MKPTLTTERVQAALRRERTATTSTIAAGLGERASGVHRMLRTGVIDGWCRVVGKDGNADIYAWAVIDPAPPIEMRSDEQFERENAERGRRRENAGTLGRCDEWGCAHAATHQSARGRAGHFLCDECEAEVAK